MFQIFPEMITPELRRHAKIINFGIIYGMGPFSLASELRGSDLFLDLVEDPARCHRLLDIPGYFKIVDQFQTA